MSMHTTNTHRRAMRPVTPVTRIGRNAAGAAVTAGILVGGGAAALADSEPATGQAPVQHQAVAPATSTVAIPAVAASADATTTAFGTGLDAAADLSVKAKPVAKSASAAADKQAKADDDAPAPKAASGKGSSKKSSSKADAVASDDDSDAPKGSASGSSIVETARDGIGVHYVWGGSSRSGWDCSGFTSWVYAQHGISLPHSSSGQLAAGHVVSRSQARPGDIVYTPGHVGIYAGGNTIIDAGNSSKKTSERQMWSASWTFVRVG